MSGEFGWTSGGYVHRVVDEAASACLDYHNSELTALLGHLLRKVYPLAKEVCWYEAADNSNLNPQVVRDALVEIRKVLDDIDAWADGEEESWAR